MPSCPVVTDFTGRFRTLCGPGLHRVETSALLLPGADGDAAQTPSDPALDVAGDLDLRVDLTPADVTPASIEVLVSRWDGGGTPGQQRSFNFQNLTNRRLRLAWTADGGTSVVATATADTPTGDGERVRLRVTLDVDNGAGGHDVRFWTGASLDGPWAQLGATVVGGAPTSLWVGNTAALVVGGDFPLGGANNTLAGLVHGVRVLDGIDGPPVADPDFSVQAPGATGFVDGAGRTWSVTGAAALVAA